MENVIRIDELAGVVERTILEIQKGCAGARNKGGLVVDIPKEVSFSVTVIDKWQELEILGGQSVETIEEQGGGNTETTTGKEKSLQDRDGTDVRADNTSAESTATTEADEKQKASGTDIRVTEQGGRSEETSSRDASETSQQENAHNQKDTELNTYDEN